MLVKNNYIFSSDSFNLYIKRNNKQVIKYVYKHLNDYYLPVTLSNNRPFNTDMQDIVNIHVKTAKKKNFHRRQCLLKS